MDLISYPSSMDALPWIHQQLFDSVDDTLEMHMCFDSSSSSELLQDDICFDPLYSASQFFVDDKNDVFLAADDLQFPQNHFVSPFDHHYQLDNELNHSDNSLHKRHKINQNEYDSSSFYNDLVAPQVTITPPPPPPPFHFDIPPVFSHGISSNYYNGAMSGQKKEEESRSLSAQSLSARQRRRKISDKTKELGKLVPGGQKMNTAEMFDAASSYIKFLQAQLAILQLTSPAAEEECLQCLVGSPLVQEKLYRKEKCIAPKGLVESLENKNEIESNSQMLKDVRKLILTFG